MDQPSGLSGDSFSNTKQAKVEFNFNEFKLEHSKAKVMSTPWQPFMERKMHQRAPMYTQITTHFMEHVTIWGKSVKGLILISLTYSIAQGIHLGETYSAH